MSKHLDPSKLKHEMKAASLPHDYLQQELTLPRGLEHGIRGGKLRADGLLAAQIHGLLERPRRSSGSRRTGDDGAVDLGAWCAGSCGACGLPSAVGQSEVDELTSALAGWFQGRSAAEWVERYWQVRRQLDDDIVRTSGVRQWLEAARGTVDVDGARPALESLARLLIGPPARRYQLVCFELPAEGDLRREVPLLDGWRGGELPREVLASFYPYPPAWDHARYHGFDAHEARMVWWAWRVEDGQPPQFPDLLEYRVNPNGPWQVTIPEQLLTMLHAVAHPGRVLPLARVVAYEGQGIRALGRAMNPTPEPWDPDYVVNPLEDDERFVSEAFWDAHQSDPLLYEGVADFSGPSAAHARVLHGLAGQLTGIVTTSTPTARAARAASHLARDLGDEDRNPVAAALDYTIALELLLSPGRQRGEITQGLAQNAAHIAGTNDDDRLHIAKVVRDLYRASSAYRHGSEPPLTAHHNEIRRGSRLVVDLDLARGVVRRVAAAVLNLLGEGHADPAELAGQAAIDGRVSAMLEAAVHRMNAALGMSLTELDAAFNDRSDDMWLPIDHGAEPEEATVTRLPGTADAEGEQPV